MIFFRFLDKIIRTKCAPPQEFGKQFIELFFPAFFYKFAGKLCLAIQNSRILFEIWQQQR